MAVILSDRGCDWPRSRPPAFVSGKWVATKAVILPTDINFNLSNNLTLSLSVVYDFLLKLCCFWFSAHNFRHCGVWSNTQGWIFAKGKFYKNYYSSWNSKKTRCQLIDKQDEQMNINHTVFQVDNSYRNPKLRHQNPCHSPPFTLFMELFHFIIWEESGEGNPAGIADRRNKLRLIILENFVVWWGGRRKNKQWLSVVNEGNAKTGEFEIEFWGGVHHPLTLNSILPRFCVISAIPSSPWVINVLAPGQRLSLNRLKLKWIFVVSGEKNTCRWQMDEGDMREHFPFFYKIFF